MIFVVDGRERLDKFLARHLPQHSRTKLARWIGDGGVLVDGAPAKASQIVEEGASVEVAELRETAPHDLTPADIPLEIVYEDDDLLVVNKPRGLAAHPASSLKEPSLVNALLARPHSLSQAGGEFRPGIVHRLDKDTTGLMVVAKTDSAHVALAKQLESKAAERRYVAVVSGELDRPRFDVNAPLARDKRDRLKMAVDPKGKPALTHVKAVTRLEAGTLVAVRLETGRTHQIRVHLRAIGHPVIGDSIYAPKELAGGPLQLHAAYLAFTHPRTGERVARFAPPPADFLGCAMVTRETLEEF